jgi:uracil-DNA glycosylase
MTLMNELTTTIRSCRLCADDFADTATAHCPRPVVWLSPQSRILVAGQAPGARVHASGKPFTDPSGDRLRQWMGVSEEEFYDLDHVSILPTSFCFPGYDAKGSDLPPPPVCAETWHLSVMEMMPNLRLKLLVGGYAQKWHLGRRRAVTEVVRDWRAAPVGVIPLPHPSWRNTAWLKKNPWFEAELVPELRQAVRALINE